jgi:hypothetical protein
MSIRKVFCSASRFQRHRSDRAMPRQNKKIRQEKTCHHLRWQVLGTGNPDSRTQLNTYAWKRNAYEWK